MFEYVLCRAYKTNKGKLVEDKKFALMIFDTLEKAVEWQEFISKTDNKGIYYIEHRLKLDYAN